MAPARQAALLAAVIAMAVVGLAARAPQVRPAPSDTQLALFERYLEALRQRAGIPGLSAVVIHQQRVVWERGLGYQDIERRIAARPDTPYRIASLTKTLASTLLMECVEQRALDLDAPMSRYTTLIAEPGATVRQVLSHTSHAPPGAGFRYDGNRFSALTTVVDACAQQPFRQALAVRILDRLAMRDSVPGQDLETPTPAIAALFDAPTLARYQAVIARLAKPYTLDSRGRIVAADYPPRGISAAAGLVSTVRDLARFDAGIDTNVLVSASTQQLAWTPFVSTSGRALPHALGWFSQTYGQTRLVWHYGYWAQFSALYLKVPERGLTLILLGNSGELSAPFALGNGDVTTSAFAKTFLRMFVD